MFIVECCNRLFRCNHACNCVPMVSVTSASRYQTMFMSKKVIFVQYFTSGNTVCTKRNANYAYSFTTKAPLKIIIFNLQERIPLCFLAFSQHVFFRHAMVPIKQKVTNTICDDQSSYPLICRRHLPFHIFER